MPENLVCPECHTPVAPDDFQCEHCELLLNPTIASGEYVITDPSIVRALMALPQRTPSREVPAIPPRPPIDDAVTARFTVPVDEDTIPYLTAGLDIALQPLDPFMAYVASFIDGTQTVAALARAAKLPEIEIKVVLKALHELHLVELHRQPAPPPPEDSLPPLHGANFVEESAPTVPAPRAAPPPPPPARNPFATPPPVARSVPTPPPIAGRTTATPPPIATKTTATPPPIATRTTATPPPIAARTIATPPPIATKAPSPRASVPTPPPIRPPSRSTPTVAPQQASAARPPPQERNEDFLQRAVRLEREGQVDRAIELLKLGLARSSSPAPLYNKLALILVNQRKDFLQASELLERAVELEPNNPVFQQNLLKVVGLAANTPGLHGKKPRGLIDRITGRDS